MHSSTAGLTAEIGIWYRDGLYFFEEDKSVVKAYHLPRLIAKDLYIIISLV